MNDCNKPEKVLTHVCRLCELITAHHCYFCYVREADKAFYIMGVPWGVPWIRFMCLDCVLGDL